MPLQDEKCCSSSQLEVTSGFLPALNVSDIMTKWCVCSAEHTDLVMKVVLEGGADFSCIIEDEEDALWGEWVTWKVGKEKETWRR